mgnify:CR=1 FL=1
MVVPERELTRRDVAGTIGGERLADVEAHRFTSGFGTRTSRFDPSAKIPRTGSHPFEGPRSTFGLLGTNGAGKTTLFRLLVGHEYPDSGTLEVAGRSPDEGASIRQTVGYLPENAGFPASFTGREVLSFHADVRGVPAASKEDDIIKPLIHF